MDIAQRAGVEPINVQEIGIVLLSAVYALLANVIMFLTSHVAIMTNEYHCLYDCRCFGGREHFFGAAQTLLQWASRGPMGTSRFWQARSMRTKPNPATTPEAGSPCYHNPYTPNLDPKP